MSGLAIRTALLLNILTVFGKEYQEDRYLKDHDHVPFYHLRYSDDNGTAAESKNFYWSKPDRPFQYGKSVPNWFQRSSNRFGSEAGGKWPVNNYRPRQFPTYPADDGDMGQGLGRERGQNWRIRGLPDQFTKHPSGVEPRWPTDDDIRNPFPGYPDDNDLGSGMGSEPGQDWPGSGLPDWSINPSGINDIDQGRPDSSWPIGLPDWYRRFPDDDGHGLEGEPDQRQSDKSVCQNIKGLPDPESGCCGVQLKRFPNHRYGQRHRHWRSQWFKSRFRRSADGDLKPDQMISGGKPTKIHQLPWMARILIESYVPGYGSPKDCGGSIISSRYVLTAAHCLHQTFKQLRQVKVILSEYDTTTYPRDCVGDNCIKNLEMEVEHVIVHPKFNHTHLQNDVALLRLKKHIPYTDFIRPICLPTMDIGNVSAEPIIIAGWGKNGKTESNLKRSAFINYVEDEECKRHYSYKDPSIFCSIGGNGEDICRGDSGGPLIVIHEKRAYLSGVISGKRKNVHCGSSLPSLFNNVYYHLKWIKKYVKE